MTSPNWDDDKYVHAVAAMLTVMDAIKEARRGDWPGIIVFAVLQAMTAYDQERDAVGQHGG